MDTVIRLETTGAPEVLHAVQVEPVAPAAGELRIEHEAIGINYLDVMQRKGTAPFAVPNGLGLEGAGRVVAIGEGVTGYSVGDRIAYILGPVGAYASARNIPAARAVKVPDALSFEDAAAILFKGITAEYLLTATGEVKAGDTILVYGAAGGVGQILTALAKEIGATVIGVVSGANSVETAKAAGCDLVLIWGTDNIVDEVSTFTKGAKVQVVYDGVGRATFDTSIDCLAPRGLMVSMGASSGAPAAVEMSTLNTKGSLFITRPTIANHAVDEAEYRMRAKAVFDAAERGVIKPNVWRRFPLAQAAAAHATIEAGGVTGAVLLTV